MSATEEQGEKSKLSIIKKKEKNMPLTAKKKKVYKLKKPKQKKTEVLNLNNEVVRMRKEVKRVRALIIRKLDRQISSLKKRKGKEEDLERNRRRVSRLLEEIHELKVLKPDTVTKAALQKDISFDLVCKNLSSPISERATARIATHPQFRKKINTIKDAIKAFKEERIKEAVEKRGKIKVIAKKQLETVTCQLANLDGVVRKEQEEIKEEGGDLEQNKQETVSEEEQKIVRSLNSNVNVDKPAMKEIPPLDLNVPIVQRPIKTASTDQTEEILETQAISGRLIVSKCVRTDTLDEKQNICENTLASDVSLPQTGDIAIVHNQKSELRTIEEKEEENVDIDAEESDLEVSEDEKEYFDDSTEERFRKQSSQSEESDDDDFFVGKVSKYKKKKSITTPHKEDAKKNDINNPKDPLEQSDQLQGELDELESRLSSKAAKMTSVFCSSLAGSRSGFREDGQSRGFRGRGRASGRGQDRGRGGQRGRGSDRVFNEPPRFQKSVERGRGQSRGNIARHQDIHQEPEQALHPSWEASKRRKEQQGQILAFQGKKIKFDD